MQDQPLMTSFLEKVDYQFLEIGEPIVGIPRLEIDEFIVEQKEKIYFFQDPIAILMDLKWTKEFFCPRIFKGKNYEL